MVQCLDKFIELTNISPIKKSQQKLKEEVICGITQLIQDANAQEYYEKKIREILPFDVPIKVTFGKF